MIKALTLGVVASLAAVAMVIAPSMSQGAKSTVPVWSGCRELSTGRIQEVSDDLVGHPYVQVPAISGSRLDHMQEE